MDWWQFAALTGTCVGTGLAALAVLRYKVEELRRVVRETWWDGSPNQVTGRADGLALRSSTYYPRSAWDLPRRSDLRYEVARLKREQTDLRREQTDLQREQAQLRREQDELRRKQAELRQQQQTLRQGLAEMRGYLRGLNL